jgi:hypothetical protein
MVFRVIGCLITVFGLFVSNVSAVSISTKLVLLSGTSGNTEISETSPGVYDVQQGDVFRVRLLAIVNDPNFTDDQRVDSEGTPLTNLHNQPLGMYFIGGGLLTSGVNVVNPVEIPTTPVPRWAGFATGSNLPIPPSVNLIDVDNDGDLDPIGAGAKLDAPNLNENSSFPQYQVGALGTYDTIFTGRYSAQNFGTTQLTYVTETARVFGDNPANPDIYRLDEVDLLGTFANPSITINVIPEPSMFVFASLGFLRMFTMRRHKTV